MDSRTVEITIVAAENLTRQSKTVTKNAFVVVKLENSLDKNDSIYSTKPHSEGGNNPSWNEKFETNMSLNSHFITLEVYCRANRNSVATIIGTARVPVSDFLADYTPPIFMHCLSYRLRGEKGEKNGVINVSVRVIRGFEEYAEGKQWWEHGCSSSVATVEVPTVGVPVAYDRGGVVAGVPATGWCTSKLN